MTFRGATVEWETTFQYGGETITPDIAQVIVNYLTGSSFSRQRNSETIDLVQDGDNWVARWDSSVAIPGKVYWSIKALRIEDNLSIVDEDEFCLLANPANSPDSIAPEPAILTTESGDTLTTEDGDTLVTA